MTSENSVDVVRRAMLAQNRQDDETFFSLMHPDVYVFAAASPLVPDPEAHGLDDLRRMLREARSRGGGGVRTTINEIAADGDRVFVGGSVAGERAIRMPQWWVWTVKDGRIIEVRSFLTRGEADKFWRAPS